MAAQTAGMPPPWAIPALQWLLVQLVTGLTIAFAPAHSPARPTAAVAVVALAAAVQQQALQAFVGIRFGGPIVAMCWVNVLNAFDLLLLSRASHDAQVAWEAKKTREKTKHVSLFRRVIWGINTVFNYRRIDTPWQIDQLPAFDDADPDDVPTRLRYVGVTAVKIVLALVAVQMFTIDADEMYVADAVAMLPTGARTVLLPGAAARRVLVQSLFTVSFGVICRAAILAGYSSYAMLVVALGFYEPVEWPPIAGSLTGAWTLRRLWSRTWHQIFRQTVVSNGNFIASVLGIPSSSTWVCYIRLAFAFAVSGLVHLGMDLAFGVPLAQSGAMVFFGLQAVGIVVENTFQHVFRNTINGMSPGWRRALGYMWVVVFLLWTTPVWVNPLVHQLHRDGVRAFSPFLCFRGGSWLL
ncbi:toxin biosynthesis protein [Aspergillus taichungensis]|uniref:Toxin biosynthesis protein n=1 Tax=Aspergillus taichungensis TaxID=482145 RepID=A0A2J5HZ71_9EURO|nr:toxin biosynthesis protein [Aspergillus taichungensis]